MAGPTYPKDQPVKIVNESVAVARKYSEKPSFNVRASETSTNFTHGASKPFLKSTLVPAARQVLRGAYGKKASLGNLTLNSS